MRPRSICGALAGIAAFLAVGSPAAADTVKVRTVPALAGIPVTIDGSTFLTNRHGVANVTHFRNGALSEHLEVGDARVAPGIRTIFSRWYGNPDRHQVTELKAALDVEYLVSWRFVDLQGDPVDPGEISSVALKSSHGLLATFDNLQLQRPQWLQGSRVVSTPQGPLSKEIYFTLEEVLVDGSSVVNRSQQRFLPAEKPELVFSLLFYSAEIKASDALFKFPLGSAVRLRFPDGHWERYELGDGAQLTLPKLPRGEYWIEVEAPGFSFLRPVTLSRNQEVDLEVLSYLDIGLVVGVLISLALGLLLLGRPYVLRYVGLRIGPEKGEVT